ncbi:MAG: DUF885 family protein [Sphingomonadales bacterium]|nr:DUF885 family protein [Sphingomonadales bacterium]
MAVIRPAVLALTLAAIVAAPADARPRHYQHHRHAAQTEESRLLALFADDQAREETLHPLDALAQGETVDPAALAQVFTPALDRRQRASVDASLAALSRIDSTRLPPARQISYAAFDAEKRAEQAMLAPDVLALTAPRPFNHFQGIHVQFPTLMGAGGVTRYATTADYRRALRIDAAFAGVLDTATARFRDGIATGVVESRLTVRNMIAQIDGLLAEGTTGSPFYAPVKSFPAAVPPSIRPALAREYADVIETRLNPAYRRLRDFLQAEYLPAAREQVGLSAMKGGATLYPLLVAQETTLPLDPAQVHALGLGEVARIQAEMESVKTQLGFAGPLRAFFDSIRTDPRYHPSAADDLATGYERIGRAVDAQIPRLFSRTPHAALIIQPYPPYREKFEAGGSYDAGTADGARPGTFYFNTYDLPSRFLTGMTTLYLHEGKPGHHFQISLALEDPALPDFQRYGGNNAYVEGWALYAETLGYDMGLYADPMQHWGNLDDEMLRAMRLVVDTGLHTQNWTRDQAIAYMLANSGMGRSDATAEVERYIANPAQALSYKIGSLTIQRLRDKAKAALGPRFDIRSFHEQVLGSGALPLSVLEAKIDKWIAAAR